MVALFFLHTAHGADASPTRASAASSSLKRATTAQPTREECGAIATKLNGRPWKRLGFKTPEECYAIG